jgi:hypothetical protein
MKIIRATFYRAKPYRIKWRQDDDPAVPADLLRYDTAFVNDQKPGIVAFPAFQTEQGRLGGAPTLRYWHSQFITLEHVDPFADEESWLDLSGEWYTYRHPRKYPNGPLDYTKLEKVSLDKYRMAKSTIELNDLMTATVP